MGPAREAQRVRGGVRSLVKAYDGDTEGGTRFGKLQFLCFSRRFVPFTVVRGAVTFKDGVATLPHMISALRE